MPLVGGGAGGAGADTSLLQEKAEKGIANGYASLDGAGLVPIAQLPTPDGNFPTTVISNLGASYAPDLNAEQQAAFVGTVTQNFTLGTPTDLLPGEFSEWTFEFQQNATGGHTVTVGDLEWTGAALEAATFYFYSPDGTVVRGFKVGELTIDANAKGVVVHGSTAGTARPASGYASYEWIGSVEPDNWAANDTWIDTSGA